MAEQLSLFNPEQYKGTDPYKAHNPDNWLARPGIVYHGSKNLNQMPKGRPVSAWRDRPLNSGMGNTGGMHFGTLAAAETRLRPRGQGAIYPRRMTGEQVPAPQRVELPSGAHTYGEADPDPLQDRVVWSDVAANYSKEATSAVAQGKVVPYWNTSEGRGVSYRLQPQLAAKSWEQDVKEAPDAPQAYKDLAKGHTLRRPYSATYNRQQLNVGTQQALFGSVQHVENGVEREVAYPPLGQERDTANRLANNGATPGVFKKATQTPQLYTTNTTNPSQFTLERTRKPRAS